MFNSSYRISIWNIVKFRWEAVLFDSLSILKHYPVGIFYITD